jgi:hypothetical protein
VVTLKILNHKIKELKKQIKNLKKENEDLKNFKKENENQANKELFKTKYFTTSKIALHFTHFLTLSITIFVAIMSCVFLKTEPIVLASVLGTLATSCSAVLAITTKLYTDKAKADSDNMNKKERYQMAIQLAEKMTGLLADKKINESAVRMLMTIISGVDSNDVNTNLGISSYSLGANNLNNNTGYATSYIDTTDNEGRSQRGRL